MEHLQVLEGPNSDSSKDFSLSLVYTGFDLFSGRDSTENEARERGTAIASVQRSKCQPVYQVFVSLGTRQSRAHRRFLKFLKFLIFSAIVPKGKPDIKLRYGDSR